MSDQPKIIPPPNCAGCGQYHGSETALVLCLTAQIHALRAGPAHAEFRRLQAFEARFVQLKREYDALQMTKGGTAEARKYAGKRIG